MSIITKIKYVLKSILKRFLLAVCPKYFAYRVYKKAHQNHTCFHGGYDGKDMADYIDDSLQLFLSKEQLADEAFVKHTIIDIVLCHFKYGTNPTEFFCYGFPSKSEEERATYLPRKQKDDLLINQMGPGWESSFNFIKDKNLFAQNMKAFFRRETCPVESNEDKAEFCRILTKCGKLMVKPTRGGCGSGIEIISLSDYNSADEAYEMLLSKGGYIAEEIVEQDYRIAKWDSSSLNTFRIPTFRTKDGVKIFYPSIRIGRAGSIVDNAGAGGTFAAIDAETGIIVSDGFDKHGHHYLEHPDSHIVYKASQIPEWDALKSFVTELHNAMPPEHKYIAYDMALSALGWCVIEANWGEVSMPQIEFGKGLKEEFRTLLYS